MHHAVTTRHTLHTPHTFFRRNGVLSPQWCAWVLGRFAHGLLMGPRIAAAFAAAGLQQRSQLCCSWAANSSMRIIPGAERVSLIECVYSMVFRSLACLFLFSVVARWVSAHASVRNEPIGETLTPFLAYIYSHPPTLPYPPLLGLYLPPQWPRPPPSHI